MRNLLIAALLLAMAAVLGPTAEARAASPARADSWQIGPIIRGRNYSVGMPLRPSPARRGWYVDFPYPNARAGHVHYITHRPGPLTGKRRIVVRYRIDAAPGVRFVPQQQPRLPATISLVIQRRGDNWSGRGGYNFYRWYAPRHTVQLLRPGVHQMVVELGRGWVPVSGGRAAADPRAFAQALADVDRVGLVLGSAGRRGHGVYATGPARLTVLDFRIL